MPNLSAQRPDATSRARTPTANREYMISAPHLPINPTPRSEKTAKPSNLDYLSLSNTPVTSQPPSPAQARSQQAMAAGHTPIFLAGGYSNMKTPGVTLTEWEALLGSLDGGQTNLYDAIYGGPALSLTDTTSSNYGDWSPQSPWDMTSLTMTDFTTHQARSLLSFSDESLSSGEEPSASEPGSGGRQDYRHSRLPGSASASASTSADGYFLEGLDATFRL